MASDNEEEDFVSYGTPLEPLEEDEPSRKPVPLHEQTVKDEKGRFKRFHGAFTGGFSAGYFNSVGSKEGWAPSTFASSRQQKAEKQHARPEDFMDEEDFGEHGIAPKEITTSQEFWSVRRDETREKARAVSAQAALIQGDTLLEDLISPARSSIGVELLRKMGWKEGQGVGPRVKRKPRRQQTEDGAKPHGRVMPPAGSEGSENEDEDFAPEDVTFAPKDVTPVDFNPKVGVQGLGYRGLDPGLALLGRAAPEHIDLFNPTQTESSRQLFRDKRRQKPRGGVAGQAFGVGALEDDDEDVYQKDSMSRYDTVLGGEEPGDGLYGWTAPQQYTKKRDMSKDAAYLGKILEGFTLAQKSSEDKTIFPPPSLPSDYRPVRNYRPAVHVSRLSGVSPALAEALKASRGQMVKEEPQQGGRHQLDSSQRRTLLGETALQGPSSVMELLRPEDRDRLLNLRTTSSLPSRAEPAAPDPRDASRQVALSAPTVLQQLQQEALSAWRGTQSTQTFRPFESNPSKQARYDLYLSHLKQDHKDAVEQSLDPAMTEWERSREREEFVRASVLYRPGSSSLYSRFTSAKQQLEDDDTVEVDRDQEGDTDDKQAAVKMKMFGKLTRETFEWHPDKLLCKRFNVPDPHPGSGLVGMPKVKRDKFSVFNFLTVMDSREMPAPPKPPECSKKSRWDVSDRTEEKKKDPLAQFLSTARSQTSETKADQTSGPAGPAGPISTTDKTLEPKTETNTLEQTDEKKEGEEEADEEEDEEESRPPMDLFKAIFAGSSDEKSSSSESENEEGEKEPQDNANLRPPNLFNIISTSSSVTSSIVTSSIVTSSSVTSSSVTSSSVTSSSVTSSFVTSMSSQETAVASSQNSTQEGEEFGPKLPPPPSSSSLATGGGASSALCVSIKEEKPRRKHKPKKHYKHNKKDKKKKKNKKQKRKAKQQKKSKEADSEEESDGQTGHVSTQELLRRLKSVRSLSMW